jgi:hypothetical protein
MSIIINPPPYDKKCQVCGKHINELKAFGHAGDPLVGDFHGALLVKTFRTMALELEGKHLEDYKKKCTEEQFSFYEQLISTVEASWECRDCIILSTEDYFKRRNNEKI